MAAYLVDLNADMGETDGTKLSGNERSLIKLVSSVNIACGAHAGNESVMRATIKGALAANVGIGAHPGYPDREGFGRRVVKMDPAKLLDSLAEQVLLLKKITEEEGGVMSHIKPHGALYNIAAESEEISEIIMSLLKIAGRNIKLFGLSGSLTEKMAEARGLPFVSEVFADRAYNNDGSLVNRSIEGSVIHDPALCAMRAVKMVLENKVTSVTGEEITIRPQTICIHGDTPEASLTAKMVRDKLLESGVIIKQPDK